MEAKKIAAILAACILAAAGLFLLFGKGADKDTPASEGIDSPTRPPAGASADDPDRLRQTGAPNAIPAADSPMTKEQFERLAPQDQNKVMAEFVAQFWRAELAGPEEAIAEQKYLSLDVFAGPYILTIKESEFARLSPEDRDKAISEVMVSCREYRMHVLGVVEKAKAAVDNSDYPRAEALLISGLERGRELSQDKEGLLIARLVGIACQKASLNEMQRLYAKTGEHSKADMVQAQLQGLDAQVQEIKDYAKTLKSSR